MTPQLLLAAAAMVALIGLGLFAVRLYRQRKQLTVRLGEEIERREQAEDTLRQSQKMETIGRLTAGIAHDFNNHLTVISNNIELLKRRLPADAKRSLQLANGAMLGVQRAGALAHRLLALSRGGLLDPEPLDPGRLVAGMSDLLRRILGEEIGIQVTIPTGLWLTRVDGNELENAVLSLVVGMRDTVSGRGSVAIGVANAEVDASLALRAAIPEGEYVLIWVSGVATSGHSDAAGDRADGATALDEQPMLTSVRGFAAQAGGGLRVEQEAGTHRTCRLYLPRYDIAPRPQSVPDAPEPVREGGATILVVEDDESVRQTSVQALREIGYTVLEAPDAMEAFGLILDKGGIDLLFTDIGLPGGVNGRALADAARSVVADLRVVITTGYAQDDLDSQNDLQSGILFLAKPFTLQQLAGTIRQALGTLADAAMQSTSCEAPA
jgi:CheY-like chemotaxis protein